MNIFSLFTLFGGLAFFMFGMSVMSSALEKMSGGRLEHILRSLTDKKIVGLLIGITITIAMQSSSATTVMLVGLVNSGIMHLEQTLSVIMGSNIGTTFTAWILSLSGINSDNFAINMLKPENFSLILAFGGILVKTFSRDQKKRDMSDIFIGFAILIYGMKLMSDSVSPLAGTPEFAALLTAFKNPLVALLISTVFTGIIQSSAATIGILQALCMSGVLISYNMAIPLICGLNIGTCMTSVLSSIGVNKEAKRVAVVHVSIKVIGTAIFMILYFGADTIFNFGFGEAYVNTFGIAAVHTIFNIFTTIILMPFTSQLVKMVNIMVKNDEKGEEHFSFIDSRLFNTPSLAIAECEEKAEEMANQVNLSLRSAMELMNFYDKKQAAEIEEAEDMLDMYEDKLSNSLMFISSKDITSFEGKQISGLMHAVNDLERMGDHAANIVELARNLSEKQLKFSSDGKREMTVLTEALSEIIDNTIRAFSEKNLELAVKIEPLEDVIDLLVDRIKANYINRLQNKASSLEAGFIFMDLLTNYERISDHCSNIAITIIELIQENVEAHEYMLNVKSSPDDDFIRRFEQYKAKYSLEEQ